MLWAEPRSASSSIAKRRCAVERGDEPVTRTEVDICEVAAGVGCDPRHLGDERDPLGRSHAGRVDDGTSGRDLPDRDVAHVRGSRGELVDRADLPADEGQHPHRDERRVGGVPVRRVELGLGCLQGADVVTLEQGVGRHRRTESLQLVDADLRVLPGVKELDSGVRDPHTEDHQDERDPERAGAVCAVVCPSSRLGGPRPLPAPSMNVTLEFAVPRACRGAQAGESTTRGSGTGTRKRPPPAAYSCCWPMISSAKFHARSSR